MKAITQKVETVKTESHLKVVVEQKTSKKSPNYRKRPWLKPLEPVKVGLF